MNGTSETTFIRKEDISSSDIGLGAFSGYIGFIGETSAQYGGEPGKIIKNRGQVMNFHFSNKNTSF